MEPRDYNFPGTPYSSQRKLMDALYESMETGTIGMFESPTGTGKTLALICAAATFLIAERTVDDAEPDAAEGDDWVSAHAANKKVEDKKYDFHQLVQTRKEREKKVLSNKVKSVRTTSNGRAFSRGKKLAKTAPSVSDERFLLTETKKEAEDDDDEIVFSDDEDAKANADEEKPPVPREDLPRPPLRILFATRTHSQLSQFVTEFRKTILGANALKMNVANDSAWNDPLPTSPGIDLPLSVVLFGSRKHMCVNESVRSLENSTAINERCRELNDKTTRKKPVVGSKRTTAKRDVTSAGCVYRNKEAENRLRDRSIVQLHNVEELDKAARGMLACPYYASRAAIDSNNVDIIGVPYSAVLHAATRRAVGLDVDENTVIIFDEAHNLVDTVCDLNASCLTRGTLETILVAMERYVERYRSRLAPSNLFSIRQLVSVAKGLLKLLADEKAGRGRVISSSTILFEARIDNVNMYNLVEFMKNSKLSNKLRGFVDQARFDANEQADAAKGRRNASAHKPEPGDAVKSAPTAKVQPTPDDEANTFVKSVSAGISSFESFLNALADCPSYGRVAVYPHNGTKTGFEGLARLKFFVLEPGTLFADAVKDAKAVLMLGGTLSPRAAIKDRLLKNLSERTFSEFECDHVVPAENVSTVICAAGPSGVPMEFTHRTRQSFSTVDELGRALVELVGGVPGGVVVFFTSYDFMTHARTRFAFTGMLASLQKLKPTFFERRGDVDIFSKYASAVNNSPARGALLGAVMGGRLSEGINFSDELGRMVVIVGMPFANASNVEMAEVLRGLPGKREQSELLTNGCLTSVNQSIGRAVRHKVDYAAIVLMDRRYGRERIRGKLPAFVRRNVRVCEQFGEARGEVKRFFDSVPKFQNEQ